MKKRNFYKKHKSEIHFISKYVLMGFTASSIGGFVIGALFDIKLAYASIMTLFMGAIPLYLLIKDDIKNGRSIW